MPTPDAPGPAGVCGRRWASVHGAGCDGADQDVEHGERGVDFGGTLLEPREDVAAGVDWDGQQITELQALVGEDAGGVVTAGVDVQAAGAGDVAKRAEVTGLLGGEDGGTGEALGDQ
jgi:hypothetical protein